MFRRIKAHPDYHPALGAAMGIDGRNTAFVKKGQEIGRASSDPVLTCAP